MEIIESLTKFLWQYAERARTLLMSKNNVYENLTMDQKTEHDRTARRAFIRGLQNTKLREKMLIRGANSLEDAISSAIETENDSLYQISRGDLYCKFCKIIGHRELECRQKTNNSGNETNNLTTLIQMLNLRTPNRGFFNRNPNTNFNRNIPNFPNRFNNFPLRPWNAGIMNRPWNRQWNDQFNGNFRNPNNNFNPQNPNFTQPQNPQNRNIFPNLRGNMNNRSNQNNFVTQSHKIDKKDKKEN
jgi:hypothetical protein